MLAFENLFFVIEHLVKTKKSYDKKKFDRIYSLFDRNRDAYNS